MGHTTGRSIATEELAERILEALDDFYQSEMITAAIYEKKKGFTQIIRAINHADRITARDMNLSGQVVVYVPADTNNIIFPEQYQYLPDYVQSVDDQEADLIDRDFAYFLMKDSYLDIIAILDRYLYVYDSYPAKGNKSTDRIRKVSPEDYASLEDDLTKNETYRAEPYYDDLREENSFAYFIPDEGRMVMNKQFETASFLLFRARLMPGVFSLKYLHSTDIEKQNWENAYSVVCPHWALELLVAEALGWLLPMGAGAAQKLIKQEIMIQKEGFESKKPGDSNVIVPHHSY